MRLRSEQRPYQVWMTGQIIELKYVALWAEQGLGKTAATLFGMSDLIASGEVKKWLVVAPLLVAETTWPDEIAEWKDLRHLKYTVVTGNEKQRIAALNSSAPIHIINRENLIWLFNYLQGNFPYEGLVYDESSRLKSGQLRTKPAFTRLKNEIAELVAVRQTALAQNDDPWRTLLDYEAYDIFGYPEPLRQTLVGIEKGIDDKQYQMKPRITEFGVVNKLRDKLKAVVQLTGTPAPQGLLDVWGQIYILDRGQRLHTSKNQYITRYFNVNPYSRKVTPRPESFNIVTNKLKDIAFSLRSDDYITLPERIDNVVRVKLPEKVMEQYKEFEREFVLDEYDIEAVNQGVLACKLLQLCIAGGTEVLTDAGWLPIEAVTANHKVWDGVEWVGTGGVVYNGQRSVVVCYGVSMTHDHKVLTTAGWVTAEDVNNVNASDRLERYAVRIPDRFTTRGSNSEQMRDMAVPVRLWNGSGSEKSEFAVEKSRGTEVMRVQTRGNDPGRYEFPRDDPHPTMDNLAEHAKTVQKSERQGLRKLWWAWGGRVRPVVRGLLSVLAGRAEWVRRRFDLGQNGQQQGVSAGERPVDKHENPSVEQARHAICHNPMGSHTTDDSFGVVRSEIYNPAQTTNDLWRRRSATICASQECAVYDLVNCGPRSRFVVRGSDGPLIVHNCNGSIYRGEEKEIIQIHDAKLDALELIVEQAKGQPILLAYEFQFDLLKIRKRFPKAVILNQESNVVKKWNSGSIPLLVTHPASAAYGLNMQNGGCTSVWYGLTWSLELYQQFNKRLHRSGQKNNVVIHHILAEGTYDERQFKVLNEKGATQASVTSALRATIPSLEDLDSPI